MSSGHIARYFWDWEVEDNGFAMLKTSRGSKSPCLDEAAPNGRTFSLSRFMAATARSHIEGLGGSYGIECLTFYRMLPQMGPPQTTVWEYPGEDQSWQAEVAHLSSASNIARGAAVRLAG